MKTLAVHQVIFWSLSFLLSLTCRSSNDQNENAKVRKKRDTSDSDYYSSFVIEGEFEDLVRLNLWIIFISFIIKFIVSMIVVAGMQDFSSN